MKVLRSLLLVVFALASSQLSPSVYAADLFSKVRCGADIPHALTGRVMKNETDASVEAKHKDLGLKNLGGSELTRHQFLSSWLICGNEYLLLLDKKSVVRDVLLFPQHSKDAPEFIGTCGMHGRAIGEIVAVLINEAGADLLAAKSAWIIDPRKVRFVKLVTEVQCPRSGIITADGGN